ncbi:hypothetical protein [Clostridium tagluense]|uniref:hypothetical protein n=1 Tax=Clostridium tagluense TaxID=360422 RepID=UPI001C6E0A48|nr:hypothetical protein [Clostridium tagluense]MBW9157015.1 hypothetical protein [Clostridium tagluense]WLC65002.1 hypothetical protein KTC93_19505 [Clostridium tagluense]
MNNKKYLAVLSVAAIASLVSVSPAFAADGDVYNTTAKQLKYTKVQYTSDATKFDAFYHDMIFDTANVGYEFNGKVIKGADITAKDTSTQAEFTTYLNELDKDITIVKPPVSEFQGVVAVQSVTAINATSLTVTFSAPVVSFDAAFTDAKIVVTEKKIAADGKSATVSFTGAEYGKDYAVKISNATDANKVVAADFAGVAKIQGVDAYYDLKFDFDAVDTNLNGIKDIPANGASKAMVTVSVVDKTGALKTDMNGVVRFTATKGALAQSEVTLKDGKASVQLTSEASANALMSDISALIINAPDNTVFVGLTDSAKIEFLPITGSQEQTTEAVALSAESNQADRFYINFGSTIDISTDAKKADLIAAVKVNDGIKTADLKIKSVNQLSAKVVEVILDTDADQVNAFTDNVKHTITVAKKTNFVSDAVISFNLTDTTKQYVYDAKAVDQRTIAVTYAEAVSYQSLLGAVNPTQANNASNYLLNGAPLVTGTTFALSADRKTVTILLPAGSAMSGGSNALQVKNVGDWAGVVDTNNRISTQTMDFNVKVNTELPVITMEKDSAEQYTLSLNKPVTLKAGGNLNDVITMFYGADTNKDGVKDTAYAKGDITMTAYDKDGVKVSTDANGAVTSAVEIKSVLIELEKDWTVVLDTKTSTNNYFTSTVSPVQFVVAKDLFIDTVGNKNVALSKEFVLALDGISPEISKAVDMNTIDDKIVAGTQVKVTMSEPVQMNLANGTPASELTQSQQQAATTGIPVPTFEFVNGDKTVEGELVSTADNDVTFIVAPKTPLTTGTWTLYIRSISDDIGNTSSTKNYDVTVAAKPADIIKVAAPEVLYADYENGGFTENGTVYDVIRVKFATEMNNEGVTAVGRTTNYVLNGSTLADLGSSIRRGITGVTDAWDGITILLPTNTLSTDENFMLNVADNMVDAKSTKITGVTELNLKDTNLTIAGTATSDYNSKKLVVAGSTLTTSAAIDIQFADADTTAEVDNEITTINVNVANVGTFIKTGAQFVVNGKIVDPAKISIVGNMITVTATDLKINATGQITLTADGQVIASKKIQ